MPVEPLDHQVINAWAGGALPATTPAGLSVQVVNMSGVYQKASQVATGLTALGYHVAATSTGTVPASVSETVLKYHPGSVADALGVLHNLNGAVMMEPDATVAAGTVAVDVGSVVTVASPPAATPAATTTVVPGASATTAPSTTLPTAGDQTPSSSADQIPTWDPGPC
jgi:hypothetical protein